MPMRATINVIRHPFGHTAYSDGTARDLLNRLLQHLLFLLKSFSVTKVPLAQLAFGEWRVTGSIKEAVALDKRCR